MENPLMIFLNSKHIHIERYDLKQCTRGGCAYFCRCFHMMNGYARTHAQITGENIINKLYEAFIFGVFWFIIIRIIKYMYIRGSHIFYICHDDGDVVNVGFYLEMIIFKLYTREGGKCIYLYTFISCSSLLRRRSD